MTDRSSEECSCICHETTGACEPDCCSSCGFCDKLIKRGRMTEHVRSKHAESPPGMRGIPASAEYERYAAKVEGRDPDQS